MSASAALAVPSRGGLSIRMKLACAFGVLFLVLAGMAGASLLQFLRMDAAAKDMSENWMPSIDALGRISTGIARHRAAQAFSLQISDPGELADAARRQATIISTVEDQWRAYEPLITSGEERRLANEFIAAWRDYKAQAQRIAALVDAGDTVGAVRVYATDARAQYNRALEASAADQDLNTRMSRAAAAASHAAYVQSLWIIAAVTLLAAVTAVASALWLNRNVVARVLRLAGVTRQLANRDYNFDLPCTVRGDEIGDLARAIDECRSGLRHADALAADQRRQHAADAERADRLHALTRAFEAKVEETVEVLSASATELHATAQSMSGITGSTAQQSEAVATGAEQASSNVQMVAAAVEEFVASVAEINRQITQSAAAAHKAADDVRETGGIVQSLSESAERIGQVVSLISGIAGQTNLLALNATIEAARAGEAGHGFAVVAGEVKTLASQTTKATEEIAGQIEQIQTATRAAVAAIQAISSTISQVSETTSAIASAVEEQGSATKEIARNIQQAATGTRTVTDNITEVDRGAKQTGEGANHVLAAADELSRQTTSLSREVSLFLAGVKAA